MEYAPEQEGIPERPYPDEHTVMDRRAALRAFFGATVAAAVLGGSSADAAKPQRRGTPPKKEVAQEPPEQEDVPSSPGPLAGLEEAVRREGFITIDHTVSSNNRAETLLRHRSLVEPVGYEITPMGIETPCIFDGADSFLIAPLPRDIVDQQHLASRFVVLEKGREVKTNISMVYATNAEGYRAPCVVIRPGRRGAMLVRGLHYINKPIYPSAVSKQELFSGMDSGMAYAIQASMRAAAQLPYNAECGSTYPDEIRRLGCGTCVSKAALAKDVAVQSGMSNVEAVGGYTTAPSMAQIYLTWGGSHAANVVYTPQGMLYMDADRLGPQSDFFPFVAGYDYKVPGLPQAFSKRIFRDLSDRMMGGDFDGVSLFSIPGFGAHGQWMTDLQQQVPSSLQGYAAELWKQRQKLYQ